MKRTFSKLKLPGIWHVNLAIALFALMTIGLNDVAGAQDQGQDQDDPPGRVARLGYVEGSVSFEPAGENDWVQATPNRPMTTGDKLWADQNSRAEVELGSATIHLSANTGISFLNLDDRTTQVTLSAGAINVRIRDLHRDEIFEIDTPNQAFTVSEPGRYRVEASENGDYTVVTIRQGAGESTGNGQTYTLHAGQRTTFSGTNSLNAEVEQVGGSDDFDNWSDSRDRRYDGSRSAQYCSHDMVGYEDLDDHGEWRDDPQYGHVWYPQAAPGWAPYHEGHWAWIDPWGWTWVDDDSWGYAPFHYGRWAYTGGAWGWVPGPMAEPPMYAPALVVFVGGGGMAFGDNVAWFPLGPREVYVPSYPVSQAYVNRVNVTNTTVNQTTITNVYNTTIVNKSTTINNVNYVNRSAPGAVTAMPQRAFASAQPVAKNAVPVNAQQIAKAPMSTRAAVPPAHEAVLGSHANTANHVSAPPQAVAQRQVVAKAAPPPPRPSFAARQQALAQHPGQPVARQELAKLAPPVGAAAAAAAVLVKRAPPGKPATPTPKAAASQPTKPANPPAANERPASPAAQPGRPQPNNPPPTNTRPEANRPAPSQPTPSQPAPPANNRPEANRPAQPPARNDRPPSAQPGAEPNRPQPNQPAPNREPSRPEPSRPEPSRPEPSHPEPSRPESRPPEQPRNEPAPRPQSAPPERQQSRPPAESRPAPPPDRPQPKQQNSEEKNRQDEQRKQGEKPKPQQ